MPNSPRSNFSVRALFALIGLSAVSTLALANASIYWGAFFFSIAILTVAFGCLGAITRRGPRQAYWIGFACFGVSYLVMMYAPGFDKVVGHRLFSTKVLGFLETKMRRSPDPLKNVFRETSPTIATDPMHEAIVQTSTAATADYMSPQWGHFQQVGHSLIAILMALLGGQTADYFSRTNLGTQPT